MDREKLSSRLQEILRGGGRPAPGLLPGASRDEAAPARVEEEAAEPWRLETPPSPADVLGAREVSGAHGTCLLVERRYEAGDWHGNASVDDYAACYRRHRAALGLVAPDVEALGEALPEGLLFFDLETTGLSGGAGTYAFLVGCARFDAGAIVTSQWFMADYDREQAVLDAVAGHVAGARALVTYNGRSFDLPLIETRYQINRIDSPFATLPHLDTLHPARRLWRRRDRRAGAAGASRREGAAWSGDDSSCSLSALEQRVLGVRRVGDVPGMEIPGRYFQYLRSGDATPLAEVFEHNRIDLISLAALTAVVLKLVDLGPDGSPGNRECLALGRLYEQAGQFERAERCYRAAVGIDLAGDDSTTGMAVMGSADGVRTEALYRLAVRLRRERRYAEAALAWRALAAIEEDGTSLMREAFEALAIHHEHRERDLDRARDFALQAFRLGKDTGAQQALRQRLARLERKMGVRFGWDDERG